MYYAPERFSGQDRKFPKIYRPRPRILAIVLPFFGNTPVNVADQLGFGERQGVDSERPEFQGRFVVQFQLDKAAGVVPAQLIASWT
ncbi:MAG: hypothetical protein M3367_13570 [Acidobacteriota bacterium]|nr:hypothetical protein [Acidobacteriota bacterium]